MGFPENLNDEDTRMVYLLSAVDIKTTTPDDKEDKRNFLYSTRWRTVGLIYVAYVLLYAHRVNLSLALVCMVALDEEVPSTIDVYNSSLNMGLHGAVRASKSETNSKNFTYELKWDKNLIPTLLSSYFYGSFFTQIPAGTLADRFGGKHLLTAAMILTAACSLLLPLCARCRIEMVFVLRILIGLAGGSVIPTGNTMIGTWGPPEERSIMLSVVGTGFLVGTIFCFLTSGLLCVYGFDNGWPSIFYIQGAVTMLFVIAWMYYGYSEPRHHPRISKEELEYIQLSRKHLILDVRPPVPWKNILTSVPVLACCVTHFCYNWTFFTILINVPLFMKEVLQFDITANGLYSSLPYACQIVSGLATGKLSATILSRRLCGHLTTRRMFQTISFVGISSCLVACGYMTCDSRQYAVVLLCLSGVFAGASSGGFIVNHPEIAGQFTGTVFGLSNAGGVVASILASMIAGYLTTHGTQSEWQKVFYLGAGMNLIGAISFLFFSDVEVQPWARPQNVEVVITCQEESQRTVDDPCFEKLVYKNNI